MIQDVSEANTLLEDLPYPPAAYDFVRQGLDHASTHRHGQVEGTRHVSGGELCRGLVDLAQARWGGLAWLVLSNWHIERSDDFGRMVYAMVSRGELSTTEDDHPDHFRSVLDLREVLDA